MLDSWLTSSRAEHREPSVCGSQARSSGRLDETLAARSAAARTGARAGGRLKDNELIAALLESKLIQVETVRTRIAAVADFHMRAILLARLQIVLEAAD